MQPNLTQIQSNMINYNHTHPQTQLNWNHILHLSFIMGNISIPLSLGMDVIGLSYVWLVKPGVGQN